MDLFCQELDLEYQLVALQQLAELLLLTVTLEFHSGIPAQNCQGLSLLMRV